MKKLLNISLALAAGTIMGIGGHAHGATRKDVMQSLSISSDQIAQAMAFVDQLKSLNISKADVLNVAQNVKTCAANCPELQKGIMPIISKNPDAFIYGVDLLMNNLPTLTSIVQGIPDRLTQVQTLLNNIPNIRTAINKTIPALTKIQNVYKTQIPLVGSLGAILEKQTGYSAQQIAATLTSLQSIQAMLPSNAEVAIAKDLIQKVRGYATAFAPLVVNEIQDELG